MDAAIEHMMACDVPCCKINNDQDVVNDPQVKHMGYIVQAPTPDDVTSRDTFLTRGPNAFFSETRATSTRRPPSARTPARCSPASATARTRSPG
ncbi:MAG: CoA transferase [Oscillospiraceae bacterium]